MYLENIPILNLKGQPCRAGRKKINEIKKNINNCYGIGEIFYSVVTGHDLSLQNPAITLIQK